MPIPTHLIEDNYPKAFPPELDEFPTVTNEEHYIDAWIFNTVFNSLLEIEQYLIDYRDRIEAPLGDDILGEDGNPLILIPPGLYLGYLFALAWDSNLLEENIKEGEIIFGVAGTLAAAGGGVLVSVPIITKIDNAWVYTAPPTLTRDTSIPAVAVPVVSAA